MLLPILFFCAVLFLIVYLILSVIIVLELKKYGEKASIWLMQVRIFTYASMYKEIKTKESGSAGVLYPLFYVCYGLAIGFFLLMFFTLMAGG